MSDVRLLSDQCDLVDVVGIIVNGLAINNPDLGFSDAYV